MKLSTAVGILLSGCASCGRGVSGAAAFLVPRNKRIQSALFLSSSPSPSISRCSCSHRAVALGNKSTRLSLSAADRTEGDDEPSDGDENKDDGAESSSSRLNQEPISSQVYADEDCYDLCDVFDDEGDNIGSSVEAYPPKQSEAQSSSKEEATTSVLGNPKMPQASSSSEAATAPSTSPAAKPAKDPERARQNLELHWQVTTSESECDLEDIRTCSDKCETCSGTGRIACRFCGGTGFLTIGEVVVGGGKACPICNEEGEEECTSCRGSGWVANWKQMNLTGGQ